LRIGVAGLGTVGTGVIKILQNNQDIIRDRCGREIEIVAVSASNKNKDRGVDVSHYQWFDDLMKMARDENVDCIVECIGGSEGLVKDFVQSALENGKHVVTANKALMATHGVEFAKIAEKNNVGLLFEAAIAGGIPIVKTLREGLAANNLQSVFGILNGTCNYILTTMEKTGRDFDDVLKEAQDLGYAEADPTFDIDGIDSAHKLALLAALAFGVEPDFDALQIEGIRHITASDIVATKELGYKIKLLGVTKMLGNDFMQTVEPCLVPIDSAIAAIDDSYNAVMTQSDFCEKTMMQGRGAGEGPTASSIVADLVDVARGNIVPTFGRSVANFEKVKWQSAENIESACYIHLIVKDEPGVLAKITSVLSDVNISIDSIIQHGHEDDGSASVIIVTQKAVFGETKEAVRSVEKSDIVLQEPLLMRIEEI
ncbi:MAG: homoserine dehydrogenase, partial [Pseudomonadota bacterium]